LSEGNFAGPGITGTGSSRTTGVANTATATFTAQTMASLPSDAKQLKNVFLYRTGDYVATYKRTASGSSNNVAYSIGALPTSNGNNYGPVACPSTNNLMTSAAATAISAANLRMCGATGEWVYYNAVNLLVDATHYATCSGATDLNIGAVPFLAGKSAYSSGTSMSMQRSVNLLSTAASGGDALVTSATITPAATGAATGKTAGTWRNYGVVFYCDDYARTDLTTCAEANRKMLYVGDPNPDADFGTTPSGGAGLPGDTSAAGMRARSGATALSLAVAWAVLSER